MPISSRRLLVFLPLLAVLLSTGSSLRAQEQSSDPDASLDVAISRYVVSPATFGRKQLYTWTRPDQIAELRAGKELLSRHASATGEPSRFDLILAEKTYDALPLAVALRDKRFDRKRFAWAAAWPTVMGWEKETYGDQLLQITLKDDAIIVAFMPFCQPVFACRDALGKELAESYVLAHPEKIAAVYLCAVRPGIRTEQLFVTDKPVRKEGQIHYREYVVCNEAMIASCQYAGPEVKTEMEREITFLERWQAHLQTTKRRPAYFSRRRDCYSATEFFDLGMKYEYSVAFPNDFYLMNAAATAQVITTMKVALAAQGAPLSR